jgi:hypothetical protein
MEYEDHREEDKPLACELQGEYLNGNLYQMVRIKGLTTKWARRHNITSGTSTIFVPDVADIVDRTSELVIPSGATIKVSAPNM